MVTEYDIEMYSTHNEGYLLLLKDLLQPLRTKFTNIQFQYQKMCMLLN